MKKKFILVYQAGIANIFEIDGNNMAQVQRVYQGDFRTAEAMARGMMIAGANVNTLACNRADDVSLFRAEWTEDLASQPFADKFQPVFTNSNSRKKWIASKRY